MSAKLEAILRELGAKKREFGAVSPMLCLPDGNTRELFKSSDWLYEPKLDGGRVVAHVKKEGIVLRYRSELVCTDAFPEVVEALRGLSIECVIDGEVCAFDESGIPNFNRIASRFHLKHAFEIAEARKVTPVVYLAFDVLSISGFDITPFPLETRRDLLREILPADSMAKIVDAFEDGPRLLEFAEQNHLEGIVAKKKGSPYVEGPRRTTMWQKVKFEREADVVVIGWTEGERSRKDLGALELAAYDDSGALVSLGRVGGGFSSKDLKVLAEYVRMIEIPQAPCAIRDLKRGTRYVRPELVVSVRFSGVTEEGSLRHPVFRGVRPDIAPADCVVPPRVTTVKKS